MNNGNISKVAADKEAHFGCKGKDKYWFGYKEHVSVDMQSSMINKITLTKANIIDAQGIKRVCPSQGAIYADKGYCPSCAVHAATQKGCHLAAIKKNNMREKNRDLDHWISQIRAPYERVFSKRAKRVRFRTPVKNLFSSFMYAICFNAKRLIILAKTHPIG